VDYWINAGANKFNTSINSAETNLFAKGRLRENFKRDGAAFGAGYRYLNYREHGNTYARSIFKINGHYILNHDLGQAKIGFRSASVGDSAQNPFYFYPYLRLNVPVVPEQLTAFGGIKGNLNVNTYRSFVRDNPYVQESLSLKNTNNKFEVFAGVKGHIKQRASYQAELSYRNVENLPFFINDSTTERQFHIRYNDGVAAIFELNAEFQYQVAKRWQVLLKGKYRKFNLAGAESPWHIPTLSYELTGHYSIGQKIRLHAGIFGFNQRDALVYDEQGNAQSKELNGILDLNAGIDYRFSKAFSAFFKFNNILNKEYQYWNNYPVRGFHLTGGVKVNLF